MELKAANPLLMADESIPAFLREDISPDGSISFSVMRHLYAVTLLVMTPSQLRRFWESLPLERNGVLLTELQKLQLILDDRQTAPLSYRLRVFNALRPFCEAEKIDFGKALDAYFTGIFPWRFISAKACIGLFGESWPGLFAAEDPRRFLLGTCEKMGVGVDVHSVHELVHEGEAEDGMREAWVMHDLDNSTGELFDYRTWFLPWVQHIPEIYGLPPYESAELMVDARPVERLFPEGEVSVSGETVLWKGKPVGKRVELAALMREWGLPDRDPLNGRAKATLVLDRLPRGAAGRLEPGRCYGAPIYLTRVRYAPTRGLGKVNPIRKLLGGLLVSDRRMLDRLNALHSAYLQTLVAKTEVVFHAIDDSITIDGEHFIRNVPAKIFRRVVRSYLLEGRTVFENREFKRDAEITLDVSNPNFEGRLNRLMSKLEEQHPELLIVRRRRGEFVFVPKCAIDFHEE